jgi:hypothetical protein
VRLRARACTAALVLAGCASTPLPPPGPVVTSIAAVAADNDWHTDVCIRGEDAGPWLVALAGRFDSPRFLCFGFGDQHYMVDGDHSTLAMVSAMLPSQAAIVLTPLRDGPATLYGADNAVNLGISRAGADGLVAFLRASIRTDAAGAPIRLGDGPVPGRVFYGATQSYFGLNTCNTWTGSALRSAGIPVQDGALFASDIMPTVRALAAAQAKAPP